MAKLDLESTELSVGGVKLKGVYIAVVLSFASTIAGGIFAASKFIHRIDTLETRVGEIKMPDGEPVVKLIENVDSLNNEVKGLQNKQKENEERLGKQDVALKELQTQIASNDVAKLQGTIARIQTTMESVTGGLRDVQQIGKDVAQTRERMVGIERDMQVLKKDVDSQWNAIDTLGAGSLKGK